MVGRDLLAWAFHSPRRLLLVVVTPLLVASLVSGLASRMDNRRGDSTATVTQATESATPSGTAAPLRDQALTPATAAPEAVEVVNKFVRIWLAGPTFTSVQAWHRRLAPYVTPELAAALRDTDPGRIPDATAAGAPKPLRVGDYLSQMSVPMSDGRPLTVTVTWDGQMWRVSDVDRESGP